MDEDLFFELELLELLLLLRPLEEDDLLAEEPLLLKFDGLFLLLIVFERLYFLLVGFAFLLWVEELRETEVFLLVGFDVFLILFEYLLLLELCLLLEYLLYLEFAVEFLLA